MEVDSFINIPISFTSDEVTIVCHHNCLSNHVSHVEGASNLTAFHESEQGPKEWVCARKAGPE